MTREVYFPDFYSESNESKQVFGRAKKEKLLKSGKGVDEIYPSEAGITSIIEP
jgi:hypothetical protein